MRTNREVLLIQYTRTKKMMTCYGKSIRKFNDDGKLHAVAAAEHRVKFLTQ